MALYLGIEIGGTKLQLGLGPGDGTLAARWRGSVDRAAGGAGIRRQLVAAVPELLAQAGVERAQLGGAGIGFGGPVDDSVQAVLKSHQIEGWEDFPLATWFTETFGWPAVLGNDADVAGLAEALFGAGQGLSPIFYITVGSGIGGGFIVNGQIDRGCGLGAAEVGHLRMPVREGPHSLAWHSLESLASGWAIELRARAELSKAHGQAALLQPIGGDVQRLTLPLIAHYAALGDHFALDFLYQAWTHLAEALCHVIALLCPRRIVIGGGVSLLGQRLFFGPLRELVDERVFPPFQGLTDIVPAALGEEVVVHGALALARRRLAG